MTRYYTVMIFMNIFAMFIVALMVTGIGIQLYDSSLKVDYVTVAIALVMLYVFTLDKNCKKRTEQKFDFVLYFFLPE